MELFVDLKMHSCENDTLPNKAKNHYANEEPRPHGTKGAHK